MKSKNSFVQITVDRMLPAVIATNLTNSICIMIDTALTGYFLGPNALAAVGVSTPLIMVAVGFVSLLSSGNAAVCSNEVGKGNPDEASKVFSMTMFLTVAISVFCMIFIIAAGGLLCRSLGLISGTDLYSSALQYLIASAFMLPAGAFIAVLPMVMQLEGEEATIMKAVFIMFVFDILFDLINIFVLHGGVLGMALASTFSYYMAAAFLIFKFLKRKGMLRISFHNVRWNRAGEVAVFGSMFFISTFGNGIVSAMMNRLLLAYGSELYVAAFTAIGSLGNFLLCPELSMMAVNATLSGIFCGEENREALVETVRCTQKKLFKINVILTTVGMLIAPILLFLFVSDDQVKRIAVFGLRVYILQLIPFGFYQSMIGYMKGIGKIRAGNVFIMVSSLSTCIFAMLLVKTAGIDMIWFSYTAAFIFSILCFLGYASRISGKVSASAENLILEPEGFGPLPEDVMELQASCLEDISEFTVQTAEFVKRHGGNDRQILMVSLCIEEMAVNVIKHGFDDGREHYFSVKIIANSDGYIIRMRDDCQPFNPKEFYEMHQSEDQDKNIGIRMVFQMTKEVTYLNTLKMNNLIIRV